MNKGYIEASSLLMVDYRLETGCAALRDAIIKQAVTDWMHLCKDRINGEEHKSRTYNFTEIEAFFKRDCYGLLADMTLKGEAILEVLYQIPGAPERSKNP